MRDNAKTILGARCGSFFDHSWAGTTPCLCLICRSLISPTAGAARFPNMNTRGSRPDKQMAKKGTRPLAMDAAEGSIVVKAPVAAVYKRWLEFEDYPKFITAIKRVRKLDANHFLASLTFNGKLHQATLEMMLRIPERR